MSGPSIGGGPGRAVQNGAMSSANTARVTQEPSEGDLAVGRATSQAAGSQRRRRPRAPRRRRNRRQSFAATTEDGPTHDMDRRPSPNRNLLDVPSASQSRMYTLGRTGLDRSSTSVDSEAFLDHRYAGLWSLGNVTTDADQNLIGISKP